MIETTDIKALREASRRETFEHQAAKYEKCSLSFIVSLRNKEGGYYNEKIDDMWYGFKLAVAPPWGRTVGEVAIESNRLFHEKKALLDQLEAAQARIAELESKQKPVAWVVGDEEIADFKNGREVYVMRDNDDETLESLALYTHPPKPLVKLPDSVKAQDYHIGGDYLEREEVETSLKAAGITIESE